MAVEVLAGFWDLDLESRELVLCAQSRRMFGLSGSSPRRLASYDWLPRIHPDDMPTIDGELEFAGRHDEVYAARFRTLRPDGSVGELLGVGRAAAGNPKRFVGLNFDLNETAAIAERESRSVRSVMRLASAFLTRVGPANENDCRPWRLWSVQAQIRAGKREKKLSERKMLLRTAKATIERRRLRNDFLDPALLGEPAFDLLLALYVRASPSMVSAMLLSSMVGVSGPVALRWLRCLEKEGLVVMGKGEGAIDVGAMSVALSDGGRIILDAYLRRAGTIF
jgi:phytoene dehydrogenase-like protein